MFDLAWIWKMQPDQLYKLTALQAEYYLVQTSRILTNTQGSE